MNSKKYLKAMCKTKIQVGLFCGFVLGVLFILFIFAAPRQTSAQDSTREEKPVLPKSEAAAADSAYKAVMQESKLLTKLIDSTGAAGKTDFKLAAQNSRQIEAGIKRLTKEVREYAARADSAEIPVRIDSVIVVKEGVKTDTLIIIKEHPGLLKRLFPFLYK